MNQVLSKPGIRARGKNWLEWSVFGLSCVLIVAILGFLTFEARRAGGRTARVVAVIGAVEQNGGWTHVPVALHNQGDEVASHVEVTVIARSAGGERTGVLSVAEISRHASHEGRISFPVLMESEDIEIRAIGYESK